MFVLFKGPTQARSFVQMKALLQDHRSNIYSKPPKDTVGLGQSIFTMLVFALGLLGPAGWVMHDIPFYRKRPPPEP